MNVKHQLEKLYHAKSNPCVSVSLNTHRMHPQNTADAILLKNLLKQAHERVILEYGKRPVQSLIHKIETIENEINHNYNLESLNIFLSNDTQQIIRSTSPVQDNAVHISETFSLRPLIHALSRSHEYYILLLSQNGVMLYEAMNDGILQEVHEYGFPFPEHKALRDKGSDSKKEDDNIREFLNKVDKALVAAHHISGFDCVVIATEDNYSRLQQVADKPAVYVGYASIDYNRTSVHHLSLQAWELVKNQQVQKRADYISQMNRAVSEGIVITDLQEIFQAAIDGRGDLLIMHDSFAQPVLMTGERTFDLIQDSTTPGAIDDICSVIAAEVFFKNGKVIFTAQDEVKELGKIVLKARY